MVRKFNTNDFLIVKSRRLKKAFWNLPLTTTRWIASVSYDKIGLLSILVLSECMNISCHMMLRPPPSTTCYEITLKLELPWKASETKPPMKITFSFLYWINKHLWVKLSFCLKDYWDFWMENKSIFFSFKEHVLALLAIEIHILLYAFLICIMYL